MTHSVGRQSGAPFVSGPGATNNVTINFAGGPWTWTRTEVTSSAETHTTWKNSGDATAQLVLKNGTATDNTWAPWLSFQVAGTANANQITAEVQTDSGSTPAMYFGARTIAGAALTVRPLFVWRNFGTDAMKLAADASLVWGGSSATVVGMAYRDASAGDSTNTVSFDIGNSGSNHGKARIQFTNAAASGAPVVTFGAQFRNNAGSGGLNPGNIIFRKTAAADTGTIEIAGSNNARVYWKEDGSVIVGTGTTGNSKTLYVNGSEEVVGILTTNSGRVEKVRVATTTPVTVATSDHLVVCQLAAPGAVAVNLPSSPTTGTEFVIKDGTGDAAANNITITPAAGNIDGAGTLVLAANYAVARLVYNGTQWNRTGS